MWLGGSVGARDPALAQERRFFAPPSNKARQRGLRERREWAMHALTRSTSGMYCWQSRIASGSQAARCSGVHCCAVAGEDANVSARPRSAVESAVGSAATAMLGQSFACAIRISIIDPPVGVLSRYL